MLLQNGEGTRWILEDCRLVVTTLKVGSNRRDRTAKGGSGLTSPADVPPSLPWGQRDSQASRGVCEVIDAAGISLIGDWRAEGSQILSYPTSMFVCIPVLHSGYLA